MSGKTPVVIPIDYISNKDFDDIRMKIWDTYNSSAQNHSNYILSVVVALVAFITGFISVSSSVMIGTNNMFAVAGFLTPCLTAIFIWLGLRNVYWCIWTETTAMLTYADFKCLFDEYNKQNGYYFDNNPPHSAIVLIGVGQYIKNMKENPKKWNLSLVRRLALLTNLKIF
jgi:hypothetical protein